MRGHSTALEIKRRVVCPGNSVFEMSGEIQPFHCWSLGFETTPSHSASARRPALAAAMFRDR
jgi:hypothetical protein